MFLMFTGLESHWVKTLRIFVELLLNYAASDLASLHHDSTSSSICKHATHRLSYMSVNRLVHLPAYCSTIYLLFVRGFLAFSALTPLVWRQEASGL